LARALVLAAIVVGDRQVERRFGVARVEAQRVLEGLLGVGEPTLRVIDHAEHVVEVGERRARGGGLGEVGLGSLVLAAAIMLAAERDQFLDLAHQEPAYINAGWRARYEHRRRDCSSGTW